MNMRIKFLGALLGVISLAAVLNANAGNDCPPDNNSGYLCTSLNGVAASAYATIAGGLAQFSAITSAAFASLITNETGTTLLMFNTDPVFGAATTAGASFNVPQGTAPTSPVEGDVWNDSTHKTEIQFLDGIQETRTGVICELGTTQTIAASTTTTAMITCSTGFGTRTIPANFLTVGKHLKIKVAGVYSTPAASTGTVTIAIVIGGTTVATTTSSAFPVLQTNVRWSVTVDIVCRSVGSSGTAMTDGVFTYDSAAGVLTFGDLTNSGSTSVVNTTISNAINVNWTWSNNTASQTASSTVGTIEVLN